jgi:hypothetical protein
LYPDLSTYYYLEREDEFENYLKRSKEYMEFLDREIIQNDSKDTKFRIVTPMRYSLDIGSFGLHFGVFIPSIQQLGTDEQADYWIPKSKKLQVIGAYS